jgi:glycosyltransferase involved in cell wall biosynthesis
MSQPGLVMESPVALPVFGFIHVATHGRWREVVDELLTAIRSSGLYELSQRIFTGIVGPEALPFACDDPKVEIVYRSHRLEDYEFPTLSYLHAHCRAHHCLVYYVHTKGVVRDSPSTADWRRYMQYFVIERHQDCMRTLESFDVCGVNWLEAPWPHFSGNFWWARSSYVATLPPPGTLPTIIAGWDQVHRHQCERWIGCGTDGVRAASLHQTRLDHYVARYPREAYADAIRHADGAARPVPQLAIIFDNRRRPNTTLNGTAPRSPDALPSPQPSCRSPLSPYRDLTSIVIVAQNSFARARHCLDNIGSSTTDPHEIIAIEKGSTDGTREYLRSLAHVRLIENDSDIGFACAANQGIRAARGLDVLLLDDDAVLTPGLLGRMHAALYAEPDIGLLQARRDDASATLMFRREVVERIGLLDERSAARGAALEEYVMRARAAGFRMTAVPDEVAVAPRSPSAAPRLSLCMIVRDAALTLRACLASARPWVDEMIIVDIGSLDGSHRIAREMGARVFDIPWRDSFAEVRNESVVRANGDWVLWMDADEMIDEANGRKLRALVEGDVAHDTLGFVLQVRCPAGPPAATAPDAYSTAADVDHVKVVRNHPGIRFTGRVHEQILPSIRRLGGDVEWTDVVVCQTGSDATPAGRARKHESDMRLLRLELADDPDNTFTLFSLGMTLLAIGRPQDALAPLCRALQLASKDESHVRKLYALLVQTYCELERWPTALKTCLQGLQKCPDDPELLFRRGVVQHSLGLLDDAERSFRALVAQEARPRHFGSVDHGIFGIKLWHNLAVVYEGQRRSDLAAIAWERVLIFDETNRSAWRALLDALTAASNFAALQRLAYPSAGAQIPADVQLIARARLRARQDRALVSMQDVRTTSRNEVQAQPPVQQVFVSARDESD